MSSRWDENKGVHSGQFSWLNQLSVKKKKEITYENWKEYLQAVYE